ncbi:hypothetical protein LINGRAHAP2_LOCUS23773 [Linum grandiflorum]
MEVESWTILGALCSQLLQKL